MVPRMRAGDRHGNPGNADGHISLVQIVRAGFAQFRQHLVLIR